MPSVLSVNLGAARPTEHSDIGYTGIDKRGWLAERGWVKTFTARAVPGAYLRVIKPGFIESGCPLRIVHRPAHDITIGLTFRALTTEPDLLPRLLVADALVSEARDRARRRQPIEVDEPAG